MATLATLITEARTLCRDLSNSNRSIKETPKGLNDGSNTHFSVQFPIIVTASVKWSSASHYRVVTGVTIDDANLGYISINPAPEAGTQNAPFFVDYYFNWFADSDYTEFLNDAARDLVGNGDPTLVIDGLISALLQFTLGHYWQARANQYASRYSSSGGMAGQSIDKVADRFGTWADQAFKLGQTLRDDYYKDLSQREKFASKIINYAIDPMTPPR
jgi:hypothetical protein